MELRNSARICTGRNLLARTRHGFIVSHPHWLSIRQPKQESNCDRYPGMVWALPRPWDMQRVNVTLVKH